jgi:hypothetical protein
VRIRKQELEMSNWNMRRAAYLTGYMSGGMSKQADNAKTMTNLEEMGTSVSGKALGAVQGIDEQQLAKLVMAIVGAGGGKLASNYLMPKFIQDSPYGGIADLAAVGGGGLAGYMAAGNKA